MKKVLIIQNKIIGDVLKSSLIAENFKRFIQDSEVHFMCYQPASAVLLNNPFVDKIITFDDQTLKSVSMLRRYAHQIGNEKYDIVFDPCAKLQTRFLSLTSKATRRISFDRPFFRHIYTDTVSKMKEASTDTLPEVLDESSALLAPLIDEEKILAVHPKIYLTDEEKEEGRKLLENKKFDFSKKTLIIGVTGKCDEECWPRDYMVKLINHIQECYNFNILLTYWPDQKSTVDKITGKLKSKKNIHHQEIPEDLREYLKILSVCDGFLGNESDVVKMAEALDLPTFSIFPPFKSPDDSEYEFKDKKHAYVHVRDLDKTLVDRNSSRELFRQSEELYKRLDYDYVRAEADRFLQDNFGRVDLPEGYNRVIPKISALLITLNEERNIQKFLDEAWYADEIIIVDSESVDKTPEIAKRHPKVKFITRKFDNFTDQKNFAISQARNEWVTFFDADERIPKALVLEMFDEIEKNEADAFFVYRRFFFIDKHINYSGWQNDKAIRLMKKSKNQYGPGRLVHELIETKGKTKHLHNKLDHYSYYSIEEYDRKLSQYSYLRARELYEKGLKPNGFHYLVKPWFRFVHHYLIRLGVLDGKEGYIISKLHAHSVFKRYLFLAKMWERERESRNKN